MSSHPAVPVYLDSTFKFVYFNFINSPKLYQSKFKMLVGLESAGGRIQKDTWGR